MTAIAVACAILVAGGAADGPARVTCSRKKIEAIKTPSGEPRSEQELRFPLDACKAER